MAGYDETLRSLNKLNGAQQWAKLRTDAERAAGEFPESADVASYVAHALRQLGELEAAYEWAIRARTIDPENLFAINRVSLLANLTKRYEVAYDVATPVLEREPANRGEAQNIAITIVNSIHAAAHLGRIPEAVERFTPAIERLDHEDLHFNSACLYALARDERHLVYMRKALAAGKAKTAFDDSDFDAVRADPRFVALLARDWEAETAALERAHTTSREKLRPEDFVGELEAGTPNLERHEVLERAIDANIDDIDPYLVYSDWLQGQSNPRGHLILASRRCDDARTEDERMLAYVDWAARLREHAGAFLGSFAPHHGRTTWHLGFVCDLVFDLGYGAGSDAGALLAETLALPVCRFVRTLSIGDVPAEEEMDYASVVDVLRDAALPHLRALQIAPTDFQMSWTHLDVSELSRPDLESLVLGGGDITTGSLAFPALRRFAIRTGGLSRENLDAIHEAHWPRLDELEIWFGHRDYGATPVTEADLAALLGRRVRKLALMNAESTDAFCAALAGSTALPALETLDLSMGTLTDEGARILIANRQHFAHLARFSVADNCISDEVAEELRRALPNVHVGTQKNAHYVSVGE